MNRDEQEKDATIYSRAWLAKTAHGAGHPLTFILAVILIVIWALMDDIQLFGYVAADREYQFNGVTFLMVFD